MFAKMIEPSTAGGITPDGSCIIWGGSPTADGYCCIGNAPNKPTP